ncbi:DUF2524 family protein [Anaerobacillus sp. MEB173]|uniref:DUF2524 family protein n=1 Tax=Anaerobacillus sp. MEB173 TaxID=3383345 RepID=UPI003F8F75DD
MATHEQVNQQLEKVQQVVKMAEEQYKNSKRVQQGDPVKYSEAQLQLEEMSQELASVLRSATPEQREQLLRAQQRIHQVQNEMILGM